MRVRLGVDLRFHLIISPWNLFPPINMHIIIITIIVYWDYKIIFDTKPFKSFGNIQHVLKVLIFSISHYNSMVVPAASESQTDLLDWCLALSGLVSVSAGIIFQKAF